MIGLSAALHAAAFLVLMSAPGYGPSRSISGQIYEVNLVDFSSVPARASSGQSSPQTVKESSPVRREEQAKRIAEPIAAKEKPVTLAKKVIDPPKPEKPKVAPSKLIDDALSRIEKKVEEDQKRAKEKEALAKAVAKLGEAVRSEGEGVSAGGPAGGAQQGIAIRIYQVQVANLIKRNWSFPAAHLDPSTKKDLEAVVMVSVRSDGTIVSSRFSKRSPSPAFDESAMRAIDRSNPLPSFPEGYRVTVDEFEIRFNLEELDSN
jgi:colicin import membrane protein